MLTIQNAARALALVGNINQVYSGASMGTLREVLTEEFTIEAADIAGTTADFVPFTDDGFLDLETSRIRIGGLITPTLNNTVTLWKVIGVPETFNVTTTSGSTAVTTSKTGLIIGQSVAGTGIPAAATIAAITATGFTLSANATATGTVVCTLSGAAAITTAGVIAATATAAATAAQALALVPLNGGPPVSYKKGDKLRLALTAVTSLGIGRTLIVSVAHVSRQGPGLNP